MNRTTTLGRLTKDPELRYTSDQKPVCRFTIAVDRPTKAGAERKADFINMVAFGKRAEFVNQYFKKGVRILVEGSLRNNNYEDRNGVKHYQMEVWVDNVYFADGKSGNNSGSTNNNTGNQTGGGFEPIDGDGDGFFPLSADDDDLPF